MNSNPAFIPAVVLRPLVSHPIKPISAHPRRPRHIRHPPSATTPPLPQPDDELEGVVANTTSYGVFVSLQTGHTGLVHISEIANSFVSDVTEHVTVGDHVHVRVLTVNPITGRIALSIRSSRHALSTGYQRVVELGGDWGHPWADDDPALGEEGETRFMKLPPRPMPRPHHWEPDMRLFREWHEPQPPVYDDTHYLPIEGRPSVDDN